MPIQLLPQLSSSIHPKFTGTNNIILQYPVSPHLETKFKKVNSDKSVMRMEKVGLEIFYFLSTKKVKNNVLKYQKLV